MFRHKFNPLTALDVYKMGHMSQYAPGTTNVYSYLTARSVKNYQHTVFFGLQYFLKEYLSRPITHAHVDDFLVKYKYILGGHNDGIEKKLRSLADLGYFPLLIKAVDEGSVVPNKNVLMTITNTHPDFYWTVGFVESLLLKLWYTCTVATTSFEYRKIIESYFSATVDKDKKFLIPFMVHDFGYRGDTSEESASISGVAHLLSFTGSDTVPAFDYATEYYYADPTKETIMASVPASEHSVMCSFGRDGELDAYKNMLSLYPTGIVSIVSDTYSIWDVLTKYCPLLKDSILAREGKVVFRPDSGNQEYIICGDPDAPEGTPENKGCIRLLEETFGSTVNTKGFKVLNSKVGLIYGDGMYLAKYEKILDRLKLMGYSAENLVIGVGGILRNHSRDTLGFAIKATNVTIDGKDVAIMKDPVTDAGKKSHTGLLKLEKVSGFVTEGGVTYESYGDYRTFDKVSRADEKDGELKLVFSDGKIMHETNLQTIRKLVDNAIKYSHL